MIRIFLSYRRGDSADVTTRMPTQEQLPPSLRDLTLRNAAAVRPDTDGFAADMRRLAPVISSYAPSLYYDELLDLGSV